MAEGIIIIRRETANKLEDSLEEIESFEHTFQTLIKPVDKFAIKNLAKMRKKKGANVVVIDTYTHLFFDSKELKISGVYYKLNEKSDLRMINYSN